MKTFGLGIYRGDSHRWSLTLWQDDAKTQAVDLTGVLVKAEIRQTTGATPITALPCVVTLPNHIEVSLSAAASPTVPTPAKWDLQLTYPSGDVRTVIKGAVTVTGDVTDSVPVSAAGGCYA